MSKQSDVISNFLCCVIGCKSYCVLSPRDAEEDAIAALTKRGWRVVNGKHFCPTHIGKTTEQLKEEEENAVSDPPGAESTKKG
jgi:hypothetical protein